MGLPIVLIWTAIDGGKKENDEVPDYRDPGDIREPELRIALCGLNLLGDDPYLRMQALNLSIVDQFVMGLEYEAIKRREQGETLAEIGRSYNVSPATISRLSPERV
jgi:hypothetical protein